VGDGFNLLGELGVGGVLDDGRERPIVVEEEGKHLVLGHGVDESNVLVGVGEAAGSPLAY
jgi:hypothetical protein|tara:strand:+ start:949 stop:1128 length:180 start_codon:yes stop_codon:yes gene_type:complete